VNRPFFGVRMVCFFVRGGVWFLLGVLQKLVSWRGLLSGEMWRVRGELCGWRSHKIHHERYANFLLIIF
jgi:hypothetical protein